MKCCFLRRQNMNHSKEITMKTKLSCHICALPVIVIAITLGGLLQMYPNVCAAERKETADIFQPNPNFKQLTNQELREDHFALIQFENKITGRELTQNEIENLMKEHIRSKQSVYDFFMKMLLWGYSREITDWDNLDMSGLKRLQWDVETDKKSYKMGEQIVLRLLLKNISDENVMVRYPHISKGFVLNSITLKKTNSITQKKTSGEDMSLVSLSKGAASTYLYLGSHVTPRTFKSFQLKPGDKAPTHGTSGVLNIFYDLSEPGEYELTFYTRNYLGDDEHQIGEYPKPCTIRFKIEGYYYNPEIKWPDDETVIE